MGTPQKLIDSTGTIVWEAQYSAFGEAQILVETITNNLRFPGQYFDAETGLHYNWFRTYDPEIGRYQQADPIGFDGGDVNFYVYARNTSPNLSDPTGLIVGELTGIGAAIGGPPGAAVGHLIGIGIVATGYIACRANGGCELPDEMPHMTVGAPPADPDAPQAYSPFFPAPEAFWPDFPVCSMATTGKNDPHANQEAKEKARKDYEKALKEFERLRSKPNKTPEEKKLLEKLRKLLKHLKKKMDSKGETHHRR